MKRFIFFILLVLSAPLLAAQYVPLKLRKIPNPSGAKIFEMNVTDLPKPSNALLKMVAINGNETTWPVYIDERGDVHLRQGKNLPMMTLAFGQYGYGESSLIYLMPCNDQYQPLRDGSPMGAKKMIPYPLKVRNEMGQTCELRPVNATGKLFEMILTGFAPGEEVCVQSLSYNEPIRENHIIGSKGKCVILYTPAVLGCKEGAFEITVTSRLGGTPLKLRHFWGALAFTPVNQYEELKTRFSEFNNSNELK